MHGKNNLPFVSVIIPCRNEEKFIGKCLDSIIANDYPKDKLEILVVDGMSEDRTREILKEYSQKYNFIKVLDNPKRVTPVAMNIGIKKANGEVVIIIGAHTEYPKDYILKSTLSLEKSDADTVGGILITKPGANTLVAKAIAFALSSKFGVGNAYYRTGVKEPKYVDTVPFGAYRREVFDKVGYFNENLVRNQDIEFNLRLKRAGGKILLVPDIVSYYYARSTLNELFKQNFQNGFWVIYSIKFANLPFSVRHFIPFTFVFSLMGSFTASLLFKDLIYMFLLIISAYFSLNLWVSLKISLKNGITYFFPLILTFFTLHFSYGLGSILGLIRLIIAKDKEG